MFGKSHFVVFGSICIRYKRLPLTKQATPKHTHTPPSNTKLQLYFQRMPSSAQRRAGPTTGEGEAAEEVPLEIEDFSCETPFERVCMEVEAFLQASLSKLGRGGNTSSPRGTPLCAQQQQRVGVVAHKEIVSERGEALVLTLHHQDVNHCINQWMGEPTFALMRPKTNTSPSHSDSALYLSYLVTACDGLGVPMPCFTPTDDTHKDTFIGYARHGVRITRYSLEVFPQAVPDQCKHTTGLADLLQLNVGLQSRIREDAHGVAMYVDCERTYCIRMSATPLAALSRVAAGIGAAVPSSFLSDRLVWERVLRDENERSIERCGAATIPFGPTVCPLADLLCVCRWYNVSEGEVIDTPTRSDWDILSSSNMNPNLVVASPPNADDGGHAPIHRRCLPFLKCTLDSTYGLTFHATDALSTMAFVIITHLRDVAVSNGANYNLHEGEEDDGRGEERDKAHRRNKAELEEEPRATHALFTALVAEVCNIDAVPPLPVTRSCIEGLWGWGGEGGEGRKAPPPSLLDPRFSYIPNAFASRCAYYGSKALSHPDDFYNLWLEAVEVLRQHVDRFLTHSDPKYEDTLQQLLGVGLCGPAATDVVIDVDAPLITQKMLKLHYCLVRHAAEHRLFAAVGAPSQGFGNGAGDDAGGWEADELEFESCTEDSGSDGAKEQDGDKKQQEANGWDTDSDIVGDSEGAAAADRHDGDDEGERGSFQPLQSGDERVSGNCDAQIFIKRLLRDGDVMRIPPQRVAVPRTRDEIEAEQKALQQLGTAAAGSSARLWLQSRTLKDDMVYFRVSQGADAHVEFVDFIRWHSPKDYIGPPFDDVTLTHGERDSLRREACLLPLSKLLSQRMLGDGGEGGGPSMWLSLWEEACKVPYSASAGQEVFHADAEARRIMLWLAESVTTEDILVYFFLANVSSAFHRMATHPMVTRGAAPQPFLPRAPPAPSPPPPQKNEEDLVAFFQKTASEVLRCGATFANAVHFSAFELHAEVEAVKGLSSAILRLVRDAELALTAALSIQHLLGGGGGDGATGIAGLSPRLCGAVALTGMSEHTQGGNAPFQHGAALSGGGADHHHLRPQRSPVAIARDLLWSVLVPRIAQQALKDPVEVRTSLRCVAERPMYTEPTAQRLVVTADRDGVCRVAMSLTEEVH